MAWIRQLPSGLWAATVRLPNGRRVVETHELKRHIENWAKALEASFTGGEWIDPRLGRVKVCEVWERWTSRRPQSNASRKRDHSHYRVHVEPRWGEWPIGAILKPDVGTWVTEMTEDGVGAATIQGALGVLRAILESAVDAKLIKFNVTATVRATKRAAHLDRVLDDDEADALLANAEERFPGRPYARLFLEVLLYCGLRYEEAAALDRDHIDMRARLIHVGPVMEKNGVIKDHPKSDAGQRPVPVDDVLWPELRDHVLTVEPGGLLFRAERGGRLLYDHWRDRVWLKCLHRERDMTEREIAAWRAERLAGGARRAWRPRWVLEAPILASPQPTPHDLRHTYGTRLGEAGVPQHEIMALMGHERSESVRRYLHARDGRFDRARAAMVAARAASARR